MLRAWCYAEHEETFQLMRVEETEMAHGQRQVLLSAVVSSVCAALWLINCMLDAQLYVTTTPRQVRSFVFMVLWAAVAVVWWHRWRRVKLAEKRCEIPSMPGKCL